MGLLTLRRNQHPLLQRIKTEVDQAVPATLKRDYLAIVVTGLKLIGSEQTHNMAVKQLQMLLSRLPPAQAVATATVAILVVVARESRGRFQVPAAIYAAVVLSTYVWEFVPKLRGVEITEQLVAASTPLVVVGTLKLFGISKEQLAQGIDASRSQGGQPLSGNGAATPPASATPAPGPRG